MEQVIIKDKFDAVLFDLDGVLTATAKVHAVCWKRLFDAFLKKRAADLGFTLTEMTDIESSPSTA